MQNFSIIPIVSPAPTHITRQTIHFVVHSGLLLEFLTFPGFLGREPQVFGDLVACNRHISPYVTDGIRHSGLLRDFARATVVTGTFPDVTVRNCGRGLSAGPCNQTVTILRLLWGSVLGGSEGKNAGRRGTDAPEALTRGATLPPRAAPRHRMYSTTN
jgi:hypothetical protein